MTPTSIGPLTLAQQTADAQVTTPEQVKAAKEFEAIFIRQLLSSLEKSDGLSGGESSGGAVFRSMMVGALADTAAEGGGIGLRDLITRAMLPPAPQGKPDLTQAALERGAARNAASPAGVFHSDALDAAQSSAALGSPSPAARISDRLGVASRVLTQARSAPMLSPVAVGGETPPTLPKGDR
jgi:Rod binding domain-containing protein